MTRKEIMVAVNEAFGANVWAKEGSWAITIESAPERQLVLADALVEKLKDNTVNAVAFDRMLCDTRHAHWTSNPDGSFIYVLS